MPMQINGTATPNSPPSGLVERQLSIEMGNTPPRLWCGVPTSVDASGRVQVSPPVDYVAQAALTTALANYVLKAGDTMTGFLGVYTQPTNTSPPQALLHLWAANESPTRLIMENYSTTNQGIGPLMRRARGTAVGPLPVQSNDQLGAIVFAGWDGSGFGPSFSIDVRAQETWNAAARGTGIYVTPTAPGQTAGTGQIEIYGGGYLRTSRVWGAALPLPLPPTDPSRLIISGDDGEIVALSMDSWGAAGPRNRLDFRKTRGSLQTPSAVQSGDVLVEMRCFGYMTSTYSGSTFGLVVSAAEAWTNATTATQFTIATNPTGAASYAPVALTLTGAGDLTIRGQNATKAVAGAWVAPSDGRLKRDIEPYSAGLAEILQLQPITYCFNGRGGMVDDGMRHPGLLAEDVRNVMPEMIGTMRVALDPPADLAARAEALPDTEVLTLDPSALPYALINSVKALDARLRALEEGAAE